jgi:hypothetical protein
LTEAGCEIFHCGDGCRLQTPRLLRPFPEHQARNRPSPNSSLKSHAAQVTDYFWHLDWTGKTCLRRHTQSWKSKSRLCNRYPEISPANCTRARPEIRDGNEIRTWGTEAQPSVQNYNLQGRRSQTFSGEIKNQRPSEVQRGAEPPVTNKHYQETGGGSPGPHSAADRANQWPVSGSPPRPRTHLLHDSVLAQCRNSKMQQQLSARLSLSLSPWFSA